MNPVDLKLLFWDLGHHPDDLESRLIKRKGPDGNVFEFTIPGLNRADGFHGISRVRLSGDIHHIVDENGAGPSCRQRRAQ